MVDPTTVGEVNIALNAFKESVRDQISELRKYFYWVLGLLVLGLGGGIHLLRQVSDIETEIQRQGGELRTEIQKQAGDIRTEFQKLVGDLRTEQQRQTGDLKTELALTNQTAGRLEKTVAEVQTTQSQMQATLTRVETLLQARTAIPPERLPFVAMTLSEDEKLLVLKFIPFKPIPGAAPAVRVGDIVLDPTVLKSIPDGLADAVPKLKGARYTYDDKSGSILIVPSGDNRVAAVVGSA
jgi:hypothetical protein